MVNHDDLLFELASIIFIVMNILSITFDSVPMAISACTIYSIFFYLYYKTNVPIF